ncbi:hypothetical protein [Pseudogemmobacter sonorensis]|uniref:hypothetical protein n=1 Tax=Pseudogemmobacter sonorensis TaxID=2989681 RepID=UPI0036AC1796
MEGAAILFLLLVAAGGLAWLNHRMAERRTGRGSALSGRYGMRRELGMEATDLDGFNTAMSRNAPIGETPQELRGLGRSLTAHPLPLEDDETYAGRYHDAFGRKEGQRE